MPLPADTVGHGVTGSQQDRLMPLPADTVGHGSRGHRVTAGQTDAAACRHGGSRGHGVTGSQQSRLMPLPADTVGHGVTGSRGHRVTAE